jgi:CHAD domain-containing protein
LLALSEGSADEGLVERQRVAIRGAAHTLAELRSAAAFGETFTSLVERYPDALTHGAVQDVSDALVRLTTTAPEVPQALAQAIEALDRARDAAKVFKVTGRGFEPIARGFQRTYARARRDLERARKTRRVEHLHDFRTHEKRHLYQLELLKKLWPKLLRVEIRELDRLGERLGEHHDLSLLVPALERGASKRLAPELGLMVERRKRELEKTILYRGARAFSETPKARLRRFAGYFAVFERRAELEAEPK